MIATVHLSSDKKEELNKFLNHFFNTDIELKDNLTWEKEYANPIELAEIIGTYIDNMEDYQINMWINLDKDVFIQITAENANDIIKYLYERFPY